MIGWLFSLFFIGVQIVLFSQEPSFLEILFTFIVIDLYVERVTDAS